MTHANKQQTLNIGRSITQVCAIVLCLIIAGCMNTDHTRSIDDPSSLQSTRNLYHFARICMGSRCTIVIEADSEIDAARAATAAFEEITRIEQVLSDYRSDSEAMQLVQKAPNQWHSVSDTLFEVLVRSMDIHKETHGAFDPTVGAFTSLWRESSMPDKDSIKDAAGRVGMDHIQLDPVSRSVRLGSSGMILDFGGIGKGYAAQRAIELIRSMGYRVACVDMGGDLVVGDPPTNQPDGWRVEIADGLGDSRIEYRSNCAIATSGDLERFYVYDGVRYSHIIDPKTGYGIRERRAVTVIASDAARADALASAVSVAGEQVVDALELANPHIEIQLVTRSMDSE